MLLRRPRDKLSLSVTLQASAALLLSATFIYMGPWLDTKSGGDGNKSARTGYTLLNLATTDDFGRGVSGFRRINNALKSTAKIPWALNSLGLVFTAASKPLLGRRISCDARQGVSITVRRPTAPRPARSGRNVRHP